MTDRQVGVLMNMPAIEMLIAHLRLGYLRQVLTSPVPQLRALLSEIRKASLCHACNSCSRIFGR